MKNSTILLYVRENSYWRGLHIRAIFLIFICLVLGILIAQGSCGVQRTVWGTLISLSTLQVPGIELRSPRLGGRWLYSLSHLTSSHLLMRILESQTLSLEQCAISPGSLLSFLSSLSYFSNHISPMWTHWFQINCLILFMSIFQNLNPSLNKFACDILWRPRSGFAFDNISL